MLDFYELKEYWQTDVKDPWCDGNEDIFRCLLDQVEEIRYHTLPGDNTEAWVAGLCDDIYFMILGGY